MRLLQHPPNPHPNPQALCRLQERQLLLPEMPETALEVAPQAELHQARRVFYQHPALPADRPHPVLPRITPAGFPQRGGHVQDASFGGDGFALGVD